MKALTLWPEWAWAIAHLTKRVENRGWHPHGALPVGETFAIHAGKNIGGRPGRASLVEGIDGLLHMAARAGLTVQHVPGTGACFMGAEAELGRRPLLSFDTSEIVSSAVIAVVTLTGVDSVDSTGWDVPGEWHWRFTNVRRLASPVACKGAQGLWPLPPDVERAVQAQIEVES